MMLLRQRRFQMQPHAYDYLLCISGHYGSYIEVNTFWFGTGKWDEQVLRIGETVSHEKGVAAPHGKDAGLKPQG